MTALGVRRDKAALSSGCKSHPATAPAGSNRSSAPYRPRLNMRNRHANWIMPRRTRALPERASPFSRRFLPLSSGEPVRPA